MRHGWIIAVLTALWTLRLGAELVSAAWNTVPAAPVYVGQPFELVLDVVTDADEEITDLVLDQGPQRVPEAQQVFREGIRRRTRFCWRECAKVSKLTAIPEARLTAQLTTVQTFGFMRSASSQVKQVRVPAFSYEVVPLPAAAKGASVGVFSLRLTADAPDFAAGDVVEVSAVAEAQVGELPETFAFGWQTSPRGRVYPWRIIKRTPRRIEARAWLVPEAAAGELTLRLSPMTVFDVRTRQISTVEAAPLKLRVKPLAEETEVSVAEVALGGSEGGKGLPLRFAPSAAAPVLGALGAPWRVIGRRRGWVCVESAAGSGWLPERNLKQEGAE